jgi:hypothetical protein
MNLDLDFNLNKKVFNKSYCMVARYSMHLPRNMDSKLLPTAISFMRTIFSCSQLSRINISRKPKKTFKLNGIDANYQRTKGSEFCQISVTGTGTWRVVTKNYK